jgi:3alpha(or 20beta)-hydroxysteroid dehydrogenase
MSLLSEKVAIVAGGARGIGEAQARLFAKHGAAVAIADILSDAGLALVQDIRSAGGDAFFVKLDVTSAQDWQTVIAEVEAWKGRVDILVNSAGINIRGGIGAAALDDWNKVIAVNLTGAMLGMKFAAPAIARAGGGAIVNIASMVAISPGKNAAYTASKWGLRGLSQVAASEFAGKGVRVNTVCPGIVPTEINKGQAYLDTEGAATPLGNRLATATDIANAALFLVSDMGNFITGTDILVDGGYLLRK